MADLLEAAIEAQIVILGERHDNPIHHEKQAEIVRILAPAGLAFEMIKRAEEEVANDRRTAWENESWSNWDDYRQILEAAPNARITGGGVDRDVLLSSVKNGAAMAWGAEGARYRLLDQLPLGCPRSSKAVGGVSRKIDIDNVISLKAVKAAIKAHEAACASHAPITSTCREKGIAKSFNAGHRDHACQRVVGLADIDFRMHQSGEEVAVTAVNGLGNCLYVGQAASGEAGKKGRGDMSPLGIDHSDHFICGNARRDFCDATIGDQNVCVLNNS